MGMAEIGAVTGTQTQQKLWKWCLYRNIGLECQTVQTVDAMDLSVIILRAGGIAIPAPPLPRRRPLSDRSATLFPNPNPATHHGARCRWKCRIDGAWGHNLFGGKMKTRQLLLTLVATLPFTSLAQTQHPSLSGRAEQLRSRLGWQWPNSISNVVLHLPQIGSVTNTLPDGASLWSNPSCSTFENTVSLIVSHNDCRYSANIVCFNDPDDAMKDMLEGFVVNSMPLSLILDHCTPITLSGNSCQAMQVDLIVGNPLPSAHCVLDSLQIHIFASSSESTNLVGVANSLCEWLRQLDSHEP